jgi:hypothetical protein
MQWGELFAGVFMNFDTGWYCRVSCNGFRRVNASSREYFS